MQRDSQGLVHWLLLMFGAALSIIPPMAAFGALHTAKGAFCVITNFIQRLYLVEQGHWFICGADLDLHIIGMPVAARGAQSCEDERNMS